MTFELQTKDSKSRNIKPENMQRSLTPARKILLLATIGLLTAPISAAAAQVLSAQQIAAIELEDRPTLFSYPLDVLDVRVPNNWQYQRSDYQFTIDIPAAAEKPVQTVTFFQVEGADYPRFSTRRTYAYEGSVGVASPAENRTQKLNISTADDWDNRTVTVTFDPPVPPGRQITVALNATNPRDGIYIYEVAATPPNTEGLGQRIGIERLNFYQGSDRRYRR